MRLAAMIPTLAAAFKDPERTERERQRQLRLRKHISGLGAKGLAVPDATERDLAAVVLAKLSGDQSTFAAADLERSLGLVAITEGVRGTYLLAAIEMAISDLVKHGEIEGVTDLTIAVSRPWPYARMRFVYADGSKHVVEFHHEDAKAKGHPERDKRKLETLIRQWRYKPGSTQWGEIDLAALKMIADVFSGREPASTALRPPVDTEMSEPRLWP